MSMLKLLESRLALVRDSSGDLRWDSSSCSTCYAVGVVGLGRFGWCLGQRTFVLRTQGR